MQSDIEAAPVSKKMVWAGRIVSALPVLLLLMICASLNTARSWR